MQKNTIYIILISICIGLLIGWGFTKGTADRIADNLQSAKDRVSELEGTVSDSIRTIDSLKNELDRERERYRKQTEIIEQLESGFTESGKSVDRIEEGADRGSEIIKELFKEIDNQ